MINVQVERPVTIKAGGKTIKLTDEQARELARKLCSVLGISTYPTAPWTYPYTLPQPCFGEGWIGANGDDLTAPDTTGVTCHDIEVQ